jgi:hypothetical protein
MPLADRLRRQGAIVGVSAVVIAFLFVIAAVIPRPLLPLYIGGWLLTLSGLNVKGTRFTGTAKEAIVFALDGAGLALFAAVLLMGFRWSHSLSVLAALVGIAAAVYSMSL